MKRCIIVLIVLMLASPCFCFAETTNVILKWDYGAIYEISGYKMYRTQTKGVYDFNTPIHIISDPNIRTIIDNNIPDGVYYWVVTAYYSHIPAEGLDPIYLESIPSNEVKATLKTIRPDPPDKLKINAVKVFVNMGE